MPEDVLFEHERARGREGIAAYLRTVADRLETGEPITLEAGGERVTLSPPTRPTFEVKAERETAADAERGEISVEFELEWDERDEGADGETDGDLSIE